MRAPMSLWLAALTLVAIQAGVFFLDHPASPPETKFPQRPLLELPTQLGPWQGTPVELDPYIFRRLGAKSLVNRIYRDAMGHELVLHAAMWPADGLVLPHPPQMCYDGAGFRILKTSENPIVGGDPAGATAQFMAIQREGQPAHVLFWYQIGDRTATNREGMRRIIWSLRGRSQWPPIIKVLLQASEPQEDKAKQELESLARPVLAWLRDLS